MRRYNDTHTRDFIERLTSYLIVIFLAIGIIAIVMIALDTYKTERVKQIGERYTVVYSQELTDEGICIVNIRDNFTGEVFNTTYNLQ
jgi:hypothetical protein